MAKQEIAIRCSQAQYDHFVKVMADYTAVSPFTANSKCVFGKDIFACPLQKTGASHPCRQCVESAVSWIDPNGKKPVLESMADRNCPTCGSGIHFDALNDRLKDAPRFCSQCGQEFDWSNEPGWEEY